MAYIDPTEVAPDNYKVLFEKVLFENEHVRVVEMNLKAGAKDVTHSHPDETVYFVKGGKAKIHLPDGEAAEAEIPDGGVM
jgi:quercetin dioxygenase-like cupin family protein